MSPRTGRPTDNPKKNRLEIRLSDAENNLLEKDSQNMNVTKTDLLMKGYAMSHIIKGDELKERLIEEYNNLLSLNSKSQKRIQDLQRAEYPFGEEERSKDIEECEEHMKQNNWLCEIIKNQLKREFNYEIKDN